MKALVVFHDGLGPYKHWLAPLLKSGFRHVFCAVQGNTNWIVLDAPGCIPQIEEYGPIGYDLATFYREQGYTVIETEQRQAPVRAPLVVNNCVGLVKAALCIRSAALTPWQLYRHLTKEETHVVHPAGQDVFRLAEAAIDPRGSGPDTHAGRARSGARG